MKKTKRVSYITGYDKPILITYALLSLAGLLMMLDICSVYSSLQYFYRHLATAVLSFVMVLALLKYPNLEKLKILNLPFVAGTIFLLLLVLLIGISVKGATRQLSLGFVSFQPSFLARIALVFYFAKELSERLTDLRTAKFVLFLTRFRVMLGIAIATFLLIILERHLSTLIIGGATLLAMLIYAGLKKRIIIAIVLVAVLGGIGILKFGATYRNDRIQIYRKYSLFIKDNTTKIADNKDYQIKESLTALHSGGLMGTGPARGRAKHFYLPEARTDYIFTIIGEEFGFLGAIIIFGLHCFLFFRAMKVANEQENEYYKYLCAGLAFNIFLNALVNTGVAMSILPSTGNTLPFISYSRTALLTDSASIGIILNISAKRKYA